MKTLHKLGVLVLAVATMLSATEIMTNADVVKMVQAKTPQGQIILAISQCAPHFLLTSDDNRALMNVGVTDAIILAMAEQQGNFEDYKDFEAKNTPTATAPFTLSDATPVRLRLTHNVTSADALVGDRVEFEVLDDIRVVDLVIIKRGTMALATVTKAQAKRRMGRAGKLDINLDFVRDVTGQKIALRAVKELSGGGHQGAMTGAMVATSLVFWPAAPFFLLIHGKDVTIPAGREMTAYTNGDVTLDRAQYR